MQYWGKSWGLIQGCSPISESCRSCWSANESFMRSFQKNPKIKEQYEGLTYLKNGIPIFNGNIHIREDRLNIPLKTRKVTVFTIWNDLFHELVNSKFIIEAFERMEYCKQHTFLILTKRPERIEPVLFGQEGGFYMGGGDYMPNVWIGTTAENQKRIEERIPPLIKGAGNFKKFLSLEPLLSGIDLSDFGLWSNREFQPTITFLNQIICGAETGHHARPCNLDWIRSIRDQCKEAGIPLFIKNIGKKYKSNMSDWPEDLRIRELVWKI